ncbi:chemotaxis protein CheB [Sphaerisporangium sp. TRM90804]|uniref:chemotaxis protein CheB n=1 Tax=Sphaerisporangium sp. TRM90804 TaxID=3031113 RepID=UPI0024494419|nr:chemotaxis protein CheB [Sphaerisporangium sp. TRM90804]MDH2429472.1 chemotaxis protein CheB [Sphaerisporangium sp. TRM90804]
MADVPGRDLVVVAASAGGVESLRALLTELPGDLEAAVLVVLHLSPRGGSALAGILDRAGPLSASTAENDEVLKHGRIYVAPADRHLLVDGQGERVVLTRGPRHNGHRPAADPLFFSAAQGGGPRTVAVVLSGTLDDGARGCAAVERRGGAVAVLNPHDSAFDGMPKAALAAAGRPMAGTVKEIAEWIARQARTPVGTAEIDTVDPEIAREVSVYMSGGPDGLPSGRFSTFTCPECNGPLYEDERETVRYECLVGHSWSLDGMADGQAEAVERAFWVAILRLEERLRVTQRMIASFEQRGQNHSARRFREQADQDEEALATLRVLQTKIGVPGDDSPPHDNATHRR